ncbi:flagellar hook capping protein, Fjo24 [Nonlabens tegetincola]|nr:flagellar hook capping protein, Fjo24 [Nonlabens tegetincola]
MKHFSLILLILCFFVPKAQNIDEQLIWIDNYTYSINGEDIVMPYCGDNCSLIETGLVFHKNYIDIPLAQPGSAQVVSVQKTAISDSNVGFLRTLTLPSQFEVFLETSLSRKRNYTTLKVPVVLKEGSSYYRVTGFQISYRERTAALLPKNTTYGNSLLASGEWFKFQVNNTGVHRITRGFLSSLGMDVNSIDPSRLKIYGQGGRSLPLANNENLFYDPAEIPIRVTGESDGSFDSGDEILFYATASYTEYVEENDSFINPYSDESIYYITAQGNPGKRILSAIQPTGNVAVTYTDYDKVYHHEVDERNIAALGRTWYGERFSFEPDQSFEFDLDNVNTGRDARVIVKTASISDTPVSFEISYNNSVIGTSNLTGLVVGGQRSNIFAGRTATFNSSFNPTSGTATIDLSFDNGGNPGARGFLNYIRLNVPTLLQGTGEQFVFQNTDASTNTGIGEYQISNAATINEIWDITDPFNTTRIVNSNNQSTFSFKSTLGSPRQFVAVEDGDYFPVIRMNESRVQNSNLKGTVFLDNAGAFKDIDYLIITPQFLKSQADRLANFHIQENNLNTKVVTLQAIYDEFSNGMQDISAIRNFIKYVYDNASSPANRLQFVNLFGDASYDYKDRISIRDNIVPIYLSESSVSLITSYALDDFFVLMDDNEGNVGVNGGLPDIAVGRMIVSDLTEAREMVEKVISYQQEPAFDPWRNRVTLIADDVDELGDRVLQESVNQLATEIATNRPDLNVDKILLDSYIQVNNAGGPRYPAAVSNIEDAFERGSLVINYFGHGNEDGLAREFVITQNSARDYRNPNNLPLFISVTCEFTRFDNPLRESGGEVIYLNPNGGVIASVATNRLILISAGTRLNEVLDQYLYDYNNTVQVSMAEALRRAKVDPAFGSLTGARVVAFIGDPALKLASPKPQVILTAVNGVPVSGPTSTLRALDRVTLSGEVQDIAGARINNYNGTVSVTVFDKLIDRVTNANDNIESSPGSLIILPFTEQGEVLFRGQATVENGVFDIEFILPRDTQIPVGSGRVSFYSKRSTILEDQNGYSLDVQIGGINPNAANDDMPPQMQLYMNDTNFVNGGVTDSNPFLLALLSDDSGINTSSGIGHDITAVLDGDDANPFILNDYYEADVDSFTSGQVYFPLRDIEPGLHTLEVCAWDVYNNSVCEEIQFLVSENEGIELTRVLNYPNPFTNYTEFWFNHNRPFEPLDVQVQVLTVTGKVVWTKNQTITTSGFTSREITWDGRDDFGQRLGKGVYIYKITVNSTLTNQSASKIEKLVLI